MKQRELIETLEMQLLNLHKKEDHLIIHANGREFNCNSRRVRLYLFYKDKINLELNYFKEEEKNQFSDKLASICVYAAYSGHEELISWCLVRLLKDIESTIHELQFDEIEPYLPFENTSVLLTFWFLMKILNKEEESSDINVFKNKFNVLPQKPEFNILIQIKSINPHLSYFLDHYEQCYSYFVAASKRISTVMMTGGLDFYGAYHALFLNQPACLKEKSNSVYPSQFFSVAREYQHNPHSIFLRLLIDYVQFNSIKESKCKQKFFRFLSGRWNQHHIETISNFLETFYSNESSKMEFSCKILLEQFGKQLILAGNFINPHGTLANIIHFTQEKLGQKLIDISAINRIIDKSRPKEPDILYYEALCPLNLF